MSEMCKLGGGGEMVELKTIENWATVQYHGEKRSSTLVCMKVDFPLPLPLAKIEHRSCWAFAPLTPPLSSVEWVEIMEIFCFFLMHLCHLDNLMVWSHNWSELFSLLGKCLFLVCIKQQIGTRFVCLVCHLAERSLNMWRSWRGKPAYWHTWCYQFHWLLITDGHCFIIYALWTSCFSRSSGDTRGSFLWNFARIIDTCHVFFFIGNCANLFGGPSISVAVPYKSIMSAWKPSPFS